MLRVEQATVRFGAYCALDHVELEIGSHETVAVLGPSGSGKTTLLRAIGGLQPLDAGRVTWDGADLAPVPPHERRFGLVFQEYALFPHRDVAGNVEFGLKMGRVRERQARVDEVLALVGLAGMRDRRVASLSGGEQQRVALARALAVEPRLLMLDEPLGALDKQWRARLLTDLRLLLDASALPALYVTHDHDEAFTIAHRVVVMRDGRIVQQGPPAEVWRRPVDSATAQFLGFPAPVAGVVEGGIVRTPWSNLPAPAGTPDGPVTVVLRPDAVSLGGPIAATVQRVQFAGARVEITAQTESGESITLSAPARDAPAMNGRITVSIDADAVLLYPHPAD
jgi:thiamine transport system ATP-binding protein